jgi:1,2-diacylglycerol 3-alpha-glucosyltransferase
MNIALFLDAWTPMKTGVVTSVQQLRDGLEKRGHHVVIVTVKNNGNATNDPKIMFVPQLSLDFGSKQGFGLAIANQRKINRFLLDHHIELIHTHNEFGVGFAGRNAALALKIPRVNTTHTLWEHYHNYTFLLKCKPLVRLFLKIFLKGTTVVVSPSIKALKYYRSNVAPRMAYRIIPNGIDTRMFRRNRLHEEDIAGLRSRYGFGPGDRLLIFVGRLGPEKRVGELFRAVVPILKKYSNVKMLFVGDGPARGALVASATRENLENKVVFTGFVNWLDVFKYYSMADIFVSASLSEVHPMTLIECAQCGLPAIVRRDESFLELVRPGINGYLAETDREITTDIEELLGDNDRLKKYSRNALTLSLKFTAENHAERMERLYRNVLAGSPEEPVAAGDENRMTDNSVS